MAALSTRRGLGRLDARTRAIARPAGVYGTVAPCGCCCVVNSSASSVTGARHGRHPQGALRPTTTSTSPRRTAAATPPASPRARPPTGVDVVVVLGGDGTLNEAANGLAGTTPRWPRCPGGSTNVFARTIGLPNDPIEATGVLLDGARPPVASRRVGLGSVNGRYFLFHVGIGFDAAVGRAGRAARRRSSATPATRCSCTAAFDDLVPPLRPPATPLRRALPRRRPPSTTPCSRSSRTRTRTPTWATARSTSRPARRLDRPLAPWWFATCASSGSCARRRRLAQRRPARRGAGPCTADRRLRRTVVGYGPSPTRSTATTSATSSAWRSATCPGPSRLVKPAGERAQGGGSTGDAEAAVVDRIHSSIWSRLA